MHSQQRPGFSRAGCGWVVVAMLAVLAAVLLRPIAGAVHAAAHGNPIQDHAAEVSHEPTDEVTHRGTGDAPHDDAEHCPLCREFALSKALNRLVRPVAVVVGAADFPLEPALRSVRARGADREPVRSRGPPALSA